MPLSLVLVSLEACLAAETTAGPIPAGTWYRSPEKSRWTLPNWVLPIAWVSICILFHTQVREKLLKIEPGWPLPLLCSSSRLKRFGLSYPSASTEWASRSEWSSRFGCLLWRLCRALVRLSNRRSIGLTIRRIGQHRHGSELRGMALQTPLSAIDPQRTLVHSNLGLSFTTTRGRHEF